MRSLLLTILLVIIQPSLVLCFATFITPKEISSINALPLSLLILAEWERT